MSHRITTQMTESGPMQMQSRYFPPQYSGIDPAKDKISRMPKKMLRKIRKKNKSQKIMNQMRQ